jgi:DNA-binding response OmpR family regulator
MQHASDAAHQPSPLNAPVIAILEDNVATGELYQILLEHSGFHTALFQDYQTCREYIRANCPDLLIFDVMGSVPNGLSGLEMLYEEFGDRMPPAIVATALRQHHIAGHPVVEHLNHLTMLYKPFPNTELVRMAHAMIAQTAPAGAWMIR